MKKRYFLGTTLLAALMANTAFAKDVPNFPVTNTNITIEEVTKAQDAWGKALIAINDAYEKGGIEAAKKLASDVLDQAYGYNIGPVLFKPTLASGNQTFRTTKEGALAYFVGHNPAYPNDKGFALKGWKKYDYKNASVFINGDMALTMGNVYVTDKNGKTTTVDKTWGFKRDGNGQLRIVLHHSSLPYVEAKK